MAVDCSKLPDDLWAKIYNDLPTDEFFRFCLAKNIQTQLLKPPWLVLYNSQEKTKKNSNRSLRGVITLDDQTIYPLDFLDPHQTECVGSTSDRLVLLDKQGIITFCNLYYGTIPSHLPPLSVSPKKIVVEFSPSEDCYIALAINPNGQELMFARQGGSRWITGGNPGTILRDIIYYKQKEIYTVDDSYTVRDWIVTREEMRTNRIIQVFSVPKFYSNSKLYMVEWERNLLLVLKRPKNRNTKKRFKVYKAGYLCAGTEYFTQFIVGTFRTDSLFLGINSSVFVAASRYGERVKKNCIYFTDDRECRTDKSRGHDMGVFDMKSGSVEPLYTDGDSVTHCSQPLWVIPTPGPTRKRKASDITPT